MALEELFLRRNVCLLGILINLNLTLFQIIENFAFYNETRKDFMEQRISEDEMNRINRNYRMVNGRRDETMFYTLIGFLAISAHANYRIRNERKR